MGIWIIYIAMRAFTFTDYQDKDYLDALLVSYNIRSVARAKII